MTIERNARRLRNMARFKEKDYVTGRINSSETRVYVNDSEQDGLIWVNDGISEKAVINIGYQYQAGIDVVVAYDPKKRVEYIARPDFSAALDKVGAALAAFSRSDAPAELVTEPVITNRIRLLRVVPESSGFVVRVSAGVYTYNSTKSAFAGGTTDLATVHGTMTANKAAMIVIGFNPSTQAFETVLGTEVDETLQVTLTRNDALGVTLSAGFFPIWAYNITADETALSNIRSEYVYDLREFLSFVDLSAFATALPGLSDVDDDLDTGISEGDVMYYDDATDDEWKRTPLLDSNQRVAHEYGGLEADVSAYDGYPLIEGGSTVEVKVNRSATTAPTANDDSGDGYSVSSQWFDTTNDKVYLCVDATSTSAVWIEVGAGGDALPVADTTAIVKGSVDDTKQLRFEVDGFTTSTTRVATMPDSDLTLVGTSTTQTLTNKTLTTPTIGDFTNATHDHESSAGGGTLDAAAIASGEFGTSRIADSAITTAKINNGAVTEDKIDSTVDLQAVYDNGNNIDITNSANPVQIESSTGDNGDAVLEVLNNASSAALSITGAGSITATEVIINASGADGIFLSRDDNTGVNTLVYKGTKKFVRGQFVFSAARGSSGSESQLLADDWITTNSGRAWDGTSDYANVSNDIILAAAAHTGSSMPTFRRVELVPDGSTALTSDFEFQPGSASDNPFFSGRTNGQIDIGADGTRIDTVYTVNAVDVSSDTRKKRNITTIPPQVAYNILRRIEGIRYQWKDRTVLDKEGGEVVVVDDNPRLGLSAQSLITACEAVVPRGEGEDYTAIQYGLVRNNGSVKPDGSGGLSIAYSSLWGLQVQANEYVETVVRSLESRIATLEAQMSSLLP